MTHSLASFALHLAVMEVAVKKEMEHGLKKAAKIIEDAAKAEIGNYQEAIGEFDAWAELADSTKSDRLNQGYTENDPLLRSGKLRDSIGSTVDGLEAAIGSNLDIAVYQELGTEKIPPRPFLGTAAEHSKSKVKAIVGRSTAKGLLEGALVGSKYDIDI